MATILYSFSGLVGSITNPLITSFPITGDNSGISKVTITMEGDVTSHERAADGSVMVSAINATNGSLQIETFQNSATDEFLIGWYNTLNTLKSQHVVTNWANTVISLVDTASGRSFTLSGVSPKKLPDRSYAVQGGTVSWDLMAAQITEE